MHMNRTDLPNCFGMHWYDANPSEAQTMEQF